MGSVIGGERVMAKSWVIFAITRKFYRRPGSAKGHRPGTISGAVAARLGLIRFGYLSQPSVRNGAAGRPARLYKFPRGEFAQS